MKTYIFLPPVHKTTGGVAVIRQLADTLHHSGFETRLVVREQGSWSLEPSAGGVPVMDWSELRLTPADIWLVPEGWVNSLAPGLAAKARCLVYVQNWAYLFSSLPENVTWNQLAVDFLSVSQPVAHYVEQATGRRSPILRPSVDTTIFHPPAEKPAGPLHVACMPRKNKGDLAQIRALFEHRNGPGNVVFTEIQGLDPAGVAEALRASHIYLATGYPEGLALPPLEAMACGCLPVGFAGLGGWDYMRQAAGGYAPSIPLRQVPWAGNGLWCADGDILDAALALEKAFNWWERRGPELEAALAAGRETARSYDPDTLRAEAVSLWKSWT